MSLFQRGQGAKSIQDFSGIHAAAVCGNQTANAIAGLLHSQAGRLPTHSWGGRITGAAT